MAAPDSNAGAKMPAHLADQLRRLEGLVTVSRAQLQDITKHFVSELAKGLSDEGGSIPMNPTWCMGIPDGSEAGTFLALDMGGTNLRACRVTLLDEPGKFDMAHCKYRIPEELKTGAAKGLWDFAADSLQHFVAEHCGGEQRHSGPLPLGFTFSYPATQDYIDHGVLQRWTKGFDVQGVEGTDVVPPFEDALRAKGVPIKLIALVNDTTGTLVAAAYTDPAVKIGCIFGTGCNAAYMENVGSIPKLAHMRLDAGLPMAINCEWGAFDSEHQVLSRTLYDVAVDNESPRPGQQAYEKMIAGLYLGEIFRRVLLDLYERPDCRLFAGQDVSKLQSPYCLDSPFLSQIEADATPDLSETSALFRSTLSLDASQSGELQLCRRLAELVGTRAARLSACGIAAICKKKGWSSCHVGADGSLFEKYPPFRLRQAHALREILDWAEGGQGHAATPDPVEVLPSEDGSGVGAALVAALTLQRARAGQVAGIRDAQALLRCAD